MLARRILRIAALCSTALCTSWPAAADPVADAGQYVPQRIVDAARPASDGARLTAAARGRGRVLDLTVHSAAMARSIDVAVLPAPDPARPAPTLYLLNGVDGGTDTGRWVDGSNWLTRTDVERFFADKQVHVVIPIGGAGSLYADWQTDDPVLGRQRWTTFLTRELPPIIDSGFGASGVNAVAGLSMASSAVFRLALAAPGLYRGLASYSGCVRTGDPAGQAMAAAIVASRRGNPVNMWGPPGDPAWFTHDPYLRAGELRGTAVYVSTGSGRAGALDTLGGPGVDGSPAKLIDQLVIGGVLDAVTEVCTRQLRDRFRALGLPAVFDIRSTGTHSWGYWQQDLHNSWPVLAAALGA
ncbi:alpha/beta hydrolase family protein [Nocardia sp. CC227C]|uniref:alpha/beta hydrolase n=1 Tax=Nocardia sp. CC227C TaxID=3044562 RepID=UPI00278BCEB6|nr:alpha/beta hydrolase family protein [Nocardia sp. CC227C]